MQKVTFSFRQRCMYLIQQFQMCILLVTIVTLIELSQLRCVPLIGCASRPFNLAVKSYLKDSEDVLEKNQQSDEKIVHIKGLGGT